MSTDKTAKHKRDSEVIFLRDLVPRKVVVGSAGKLRLGERRGPPASEEAPPPHRRKERTKRSP